MGTRSQYSLDQPWAISPQLSRSTLSTKIDNQSYPIESHFATKEQKQQLRPDSLQSRRQIQPCPGFLKIETPVFRLQATRPAHELKRIPAIDIASHSQDFDSQHPQKTAFCDFCSDATTKHATKADSSMSTAAIVEDSSNNSLSHRIVNVSDGGRQRFLIRSSSSAISFTSSVGTSMTDASMQDGGDTISEPTTPLSTYDGDQAVSLQDQGHALLWPLEPTASSPSSSSSLDEEEQDFEQNHASEKESSPVSWFQTCSSTTPTIQESGFERTKEAKTKPVFNQAGKHFFVVDVTGEEDTDGIVVEVKDQGRPSFSSESASSSSSSRTMMSPVPTWSSCATKTETATETKTETEVEIGIKGEKRASAISFLRRGPNARSKSAKPNFRQKIERAVNSPWPWGKSLQNEDDDGNNATKPLSQKYVLNYISDPNHPLVDNHELDRLHPHNPFFQVQQGVPFQQVVPERPARFPYPRKIEYTSTCSRTGLRIRPTVSSCYNNHSSTFSTDASTSSTASSQHSLTPLLAMSTSYANQQQQQLQYFLSSQDEEEARRREQVHRFLLQRVKTREGSNQVRRRTNIVLTNPAFRQETEPVVVARFRRIYSRDKQQQQIPVETKEDHRNSTAVAITSNCMRAEFISRLSTHNIRGSKGKENFKTVHATTSFKKQFERYQQLCRERAFSRQTPRASTPIESTGTVASPKLTFERTNLVLTSIRFQEVSKQQQGFDQSSSSSSTAFLSSLHSFGSTPFDAESHKFLPVALEHHIKRASHRFEDNGTGVCFNMQTQELSPTRCLSLNHLSVTSLTSASSNISSVYSTLSARWQRPLFYEKSKSRRYPQSLQVHIKVKDGGQQQQVVDGTAASVFDVNDTSAMRAAGIDPEEAHADPEAFYHRHFAYFQKHGSFLEDITSTPTTKVEPEQAGETATSSVVPEPKAESSTPELCDNRKLLAFLPRPLKRVVTATRGSWSRSRRTLPGLVKRAKVQCQSSLARLKEKGKWKEKQVKEIHEILFMSASMNRRWKDNDEEEIGAWVLKIPADHGRIGQFDCNWLDALEV